jgi:hypothetical protein
MYKARSLNARKEIQSVCRVAWKKEVTEGNVDVGKEDNIKIDPKEMEWVCVDWFHVAFERDQWLLRNFGCYKILGISWIAE